jgi:Protein of unknown function (DUF2795)
VDQNPMISDEVQKYLQDIEYPASKEDIVSNAQSKGAPQSLIDKINNLSQDSFSEPQEVSNALLQDYS